MVEVDVDDGEGLATMSKVAGRNHVTSRSDKPDEATDLSGQSEVRLRPYPLRAKVVGRRARMLLDIMVMQSSMVWMLGPARFRVK